ncbi:hypothetical protein LWI29_005771 [Acer saccharum]|uniref:RNase H type-1 domain-containing protein n=1 Tax=Acer saccharum TaxID=4024 RepID=A0AA39S8Z0_ACESA|nr:hypothetical protein LWI29_005771 [Acer saccharum]
MKFAYRLLTSEGLWAEFFKAKYLRDSHLMSCTMQASVSRFWRSVVASVPEVMENVQVLLGGGNSYFWYDRWLASGPLSVRITDIPNKKLRIKDCWVDKAWNIEILKGLVGNKVMEEIIQTRISGRGGSDICVWKPSPDDNFTTASACSDMGACFLNVPCLLFDTWKTRIPAWMISAKKVSLSSNLTGSSRGGGILRDANGYFKGAFTSHYSVGSNNRAELKALFDGIRLCKRLSYSSVIIVSDSKIVVDWFRVGKCTLWYLWDFWDGCIKEMQGMNVRIVHQSREGNQAADFLAKLGESGSNVIYEEFQELPRLLQGIVRIDRSGLPAIRH